MTRKRVGQGCSRRSPSRASTATAAATIVHTEPVERGLAATAATSGRPQAQAGRARADKAEGRSAPPSTEAARGGGRAKAATTRSARPPAIVAAPTRPVPGRAGRAPAGRGRRTPRRSALEDRRRARRRVDAAVEGAVADLADAGRSRATPPATGGQSRHRRSPWRPGTGRAGGTGGLTGCPAGLALRTVPISTAPGAASVTARAHRPARAPRGPDASPRKRAGVHDGVRDRPRWWSPGEGRRRRRPRDRPGPG